MLTPPSSSAFGHWPISSLLLPISSDLSQCCSSGVFPLHMVLPLWDIWLSVHVTSSSSDFSLSVIIAGRCWLISSHCPRLCGGALTSSVSSCEPLLMDRAVADTVSALTRSPWITVTISMLQCFLPLLHRSCSYSLEDCSCTTVAILPASTEPRV